MRRFVEAIFFSSLSDMDSTICLEALRRDFSVRSPRLADNAAPAAICCFLDIAGMILKIIVWIDKKAPRSQSSMRPFKRLGNILPGGLVSLEASSKALLRLLPEIELASLGGTCMFPQKIGTGGNLVV